MTRCRISTPTAFEAETFGWSKGVATESTERTSAEFGADAPNLVVRDLDAGDWTALSSVAFGDEGAATVTASVLPLQEGGQIEVRAGAEDGPLLGTIEVEGEVGEWTEVSADLTGATGTTDVFFVFTGGEGNVVELDAWTFAQGSEAPGLDVDVETGARCVVGRTVLTARVVNNEDVPVSLELASPYGTRSSTDLAPGARASHAFTTRQVAMPAGSIAVTITGTVDGQPVTTTVEAPFAADSCG